VDVRSVHHVAFAVEDLDAAVETYRSLFGAEVEVRGRLEAQGVEAVYLRLGTGRVELVAPLADDTHVGRFLAARARCRWVFTVPSGMPSVSATS